MRAERIELVARRALDDRAGAAVALAWYDDARSFADELAEVYGFPFTVVAGVLAALSPLQEWATQLSFTPQILSVAAERLRNQSHDADDEMIDGLAERIPGPGFKANKRKAASILCGRDPRGVLSGSKVRAFYDCIVGRVDSVCVDRHAWAIAGAVGTLTDRRYRDTATAYVVAAARLRAAFPRVAGLTPAGVQALCWVWWRDNEGERF